MDYTFYREEPYKTMLGNIQAERKIIYLAMGGSHAYGTNVEGSDIDLRGIALRTPKEILGTGQFEQFINQETDTTIYSMDKIFKLLLNCNPNCIELLGVKDEHKLLVAPEMQMILDNKDIFLSRIAIKSFAGYATSQLRRLENAVSKHMEQSRKEEHMMNTLMNMQEHLRRVYTSYTDSEFKLYMDDTEREGFDKEMFVDFNFQHYPLRDFYNIQSEMTSAISAYDKLNHKNNKKSEMKLDKHVMHLVRLYLMLFDILEKGEINTYRENEHDFLMAIRNGECSDNNYEVIYSELEKYKTRLEYAKKHTELPNSPDYKKAEELLIEINRGVIL